MNFFKKIKGRIQSTPLGVYIVIFLIVLYVLMQIPSSAYLIENATDIGFKLLIAPVIAIGGFMAFYDSAKGIFKKSAFDSGMVVYILWWLWLILLFAFSTGVGLLFIRYIIELISNF